MIVNSYMNFYEYFFEAVLPNWDKLLSSSEELSIAVQVMDRIESSTGESTLIVGGAVRDMLLGKVPHDVDIATGAEISEVEKLFKTVNLGNSKDFGIVVVDYKGHQFEIANFREDEYDNDISSDTGSSLDNRKPSSVKLVKSYETDSARRDITINSLGLDRNGEIIDYQGGISDLNNKLIKAVGVARNRFIEDALRILRVLRFSVKLGFEIESETLSAAKELSYLVDNLSMERIQGELYKVAELGGSALADYILKMDEIGLLQRVFPEVYKLKGYKHNPEHHPEGGSIVFGHVLEALKKSKSKDAVTNISILLHDIGKPDSYKEEVITNSGRVRTHTYDNHDKIGIDVIDVIGKRLKLSTSDMNAIKFAAANHMKLHVGTDISKSKLSKLVNDPNWEVLKNVVYADEMASGDKNGNDVWDHLEQLELSILNTVGNRVELDSKMKNLVNGAKILKRYPELNTRENRPIIGQIIKKTSEYILDNDLIDISSDESDEIINTFYKRIMQDEN